MLPNTVRMDKIFSEFESDLKTLEILTAQSLRELDSDACADLSRWICDWSILDDLREESPII